MHAEEGFHITHLVIAAIFNGGRYFNAIPERLHRDTGHESLGLWYLENDIVMGVYPLGFL